jgi:hypothetical protein
MERQHTHSASLKAIAGSALVGFGVLVVLGNLGWSSLLKNCFCASAGDALALLPCLVMAACQAMLAFVLDHHGPLGWLLQMLASLWPLLPGGGGTI